MKIIHRLAIVAVTAFILCNCGKSDVKPDFVTHEDLPANMKKVYLFVRDTTTRQQIAGASIKFKTKNGLVLFEGTSKPDKPWDYMGTGYKSSDFMINGTSVEIEKDGYLDFKMNFEDIPSVEKAKNSFEVYATLQKK